MKNLEEKENKKKNEIDILDKTLDDMSILEKTVDEMLKGLLFIILCMLMLLVIIFIFASVDMISDMIQ